ncbi:phage recombination protein Bet [Gluconobacter japonicus]|uniref:phage recombination protein Bet n=1 Tax=Gluconobacter japonicus TaxID=376620 RepID=UPI003D2BB1CB
MNAVAKTSQQMGAVTERDLMDTLKNSLYPGASDAAVHMVIGYCRAAGLDVMKKPVHIVPIWSKAAGGMIDTVMPGIALYRIEAARTGQYLGKSEPEFGPVRTMKLGGRDVRFPEWCKVTVKRLVAGHVCEFPAMEFWLENYATAKKDTDAPNAMWAKRSFGQLAKCAEAQALRMAFPELTGGTNTNDEMEGKTFAEPVDVTPQPTQTRQLQREERPVDHIQWFKSRLANCPDTRGVEALQTNWSKTQDKAMQVGRPIPDDTIEAVQDLIADRYGELVQQEQQQAAENAAVDLEEMPA